MLLLFTTRHSLKVYTYTCRPTVLCLLPTHRSIMPQLFTTWHKSTYRLFHQHRHFRDITYMRPTSIQCYQNVALTLTTFSNWTTLHYINYIIPCNCINVYNINTPYEKYTVGTCNVNIKSSWNILKYVQYTERLVHNWYTRYD